MKQFVVNRRANVEPIPFGVGSSEGTPAPGAFIVVPSTGAALRVVATVYAQRDGVTAIFIVCDPYVPPRETPATVESGRDPVNVVTSLASLDA